MSAKVGNLKFSYAVIIHPVYAIEEAQELFQIY
jgi:hypothetical protein